MNQRKTAAESQSIQVKLRSDRDDARKTVEKLTAKDTYFQVCPFAIPVMCRIGSGENLWRLGV